MIHHHTLHCDWFADMFRKENSESAGGGLRTLSATIVHGRIKTPTKRPRYQLGFPFLEVLFIPFLSAKGESSRVGQIRSLTKRRCTAMLLILRGRLRLLAWRPAPTPLGTSPPASCLVCRVLKNRFHFSVDKIRHLVRTPFSNST